jgi:hypothetical protein
MAELELEPILLLDWRLALDSGFALNTGFTPQ